MLKRLKRTSKMVEGAEMFKSNDCVAIHLEDLTAAENFYSNVMKFRLVNRSEESLEYDTGHFRLYVNRDLDTRPPIPRLTVADIAAAKRALVENGCIILREDESSLKFEDPFGITYDVMQGK